MQFIYVHIESPQGQTLYEERHTGPSAWGELTRAHLMAWAATMASHLPVAEAKAILAFVLFRIPKKLSTPLKRSGCIETGKSVSWMFKRNKLDTWLIPSIWKGVFKYYGPKSRLANVTTSEFMLTELCYEQFGNTKNTEYLDTLAAILFRPQRFWGIDTDIRQKLTTHGYIKRAKKFKSLSLKLKFAIYLNYEGCRNFIIDKNPDVFISRSSSGESRPKTVTQWSKIVESAAGGKFGSMKETKESNVHEFLSELGARIREKREFDKQTAK